MNPGKLNKRIIIQSYTSAKDPHGGENGSWATASTVWASVLTLTGRKLEIARSIDAEATVEIKIRYCSNLTITVDNRILYGTRILEPTLVINEFEENRFYIITCKEKRGDLLDD